MGDELDKRAWLRSAFPSYGPDWDAAIEFGVDVSLLVRNLELTPLERLQELDDLSRLASMVGLDPADPQNPELLRAIRDLRNVTGKR